MTRRLHRERMRWYSYQPRLLFTVSRIALGDQPGVVRAVIDRSRRGLGDVNIQMLQLTPEHFTRHEYAVLIEPKRGRHRLHATAHRRAAPDYRLPRGPLEWVRPPWARTWHYLERGPR